MSEARPGVPESVVRRFGDLRLLKAGGGVSTYLATGGSADDGQGRVVVKLADLSTVGAAVSMRLTHEADVLGRLSGPDGHPFLIDHGVEAGCIWLAQRYQAGRTLEERLSAGPLDVDEALWLATDVLRQLVTAHEHSIVHRDIKPANIIVDEAGPVTGAALIDFGLAQSVRLAPALHDIAVGTARYCSPEQAGLIDVPLDERSDLYSMGLTLFECLAGRPMLDAAAVGDVLRQHLAVKPSLGDISTAVPRAVSEMVSRLTHTDPDRRYQTAEAVLADVEDIIAARAGGLSDPSVVIGRHDRRRSLADPGFVGRSGEIAALESELAEAAEGRGGVVFLEGESGAGKSRLLDELARLASSRGFLVLRGNGEDRTASRPFQIFDGVTRDLAKAAAASPELAGRLRMSLTERSHAVGSVAPHLAPYLGEAQQAGPLPEEHGQQRSVAALAAVLDASGEGPEPALVILDDCQWAQTLVTRVLTHWTAQPGARRVMVVAAFRADEVSSSSQLRTVPTRKRLGLGGLSDSDVRDLVTSMAGPVPEPAAEAVVRLAEGNAFMAQAVLRGMTESGVLVRDNDRWEIDERSAGEVQTSRRAALFLLKRLDALSPAARDLLSASAVIGKESDVDVAIMLSGLPATEAVPALDEVRRRRILWLDESRGRVRFSHDMLRETVLERLDDDLRADLHMRAANHFLSEGDRAPYQVAYHLDMAGRPAEAFPHAVAAAESARARHALEEAASYYLIARKGAVTEEDRFRIADGLGEVLSLAGDYGEAERYFTEAAGLASNQKDEAAELGKLGEVSFRRGDQVAAGDRLEAAVRKLGVRLPPGRVLLILALIWELLVQGVHSLSGNRLVLRRHPTERDVLRMRFLSRLAYVYWFRNGRLRCAWGHLREMNMAERFRDPAAMAQAYSEHSPVMTTIPWYARGIGYANRSLELRRGLGDVWGQGQSLNFYGVGLYAASRYRESVEALEESVRILALTGDRWEMNTGLWNLALAQYRLGQWGRAAAVATDLYRTASTIGDRSSAGIALAILARATSGASPSDSAIEVEAARRDEDQHTAAEVQLARALRLMARNRPAEAATVLEAAWAEVKRAGLRQEYVAPLLPWWATALRLQLESHAGVADAERERLARRHRQVATRAVRLSRSYRNNLPHALRERALAHARAGRLRRALRDLDRSMELARSQGAAWEEATSRVERGRLGAIFGWPGAQEDLVRGQAEKSRIEAEGRGLVVETPHGPTLSLADRFASLLEVGRDIAASTSVAGVIRAVEDAVNKLLRSDHCFVIEIGPDLEPVEERVAAWSDIVSRSAIKEAVTTGMVVRRGGTGLTAVADSMVLAGIRSLICAPIERDGRVVACIHATHREVDGLFGEAEGQVAYFIATLAGAALEHVAGSEAYFRSLIEHSHDITAVIDAQGRSTYVSSSVERILGQRAEDLEGRPHSDFVHGDDLEELARNWAEALHEPGPPRTTEVRFLHADGSWRWMDMTMSNRLDDPNVSGMILNLRDSTERRQAELDLARAAERFRLAFDHAPIGMALVDQKPDGRSRILMSNEALAAMLGIKSAALVGQPIEGYVHPEDRHIGLKALRGFMRGERDLADGEVRLRHDNGTWLWVRFRAALIRTEAGEPDYFIAQVMDITDQRAAEEQLIHQALHDPLTGLPNRRLLMDRLEQALARAERMQRHVAVLFLDLDRFKVINDSFGHATGDVVLIEAARRLEELTRTSDTLARLGGDEFVVLVEDLVDVEEARAVAQRIEDALSRPMTVSPDVVVSITTSVGITVARPGDGPAVLLRDADTALYRAKERGRARHEVFGDHLRMRAIGRMSIERDLRSAVEEGRLLALFQPVVDLDKGNTVGAEAVLHYRSTDGDTIGPAEFLEVAEETGLIVPMGTWLLQTACMELASWQDRFGDDALRVIVDVSPRQLLAPGFPGTVGEALAEAGIKATSLSLQISEAALSGSMEATRKTMAELRAMGCEVGIAGFGTGYSSLAYLRRLPIDFLKIDGSFVHGVGSDQEDETIVDTVIKLAEALSLTTRADGVETRLQERILSRLGCNLAQGPRFGRLCSSEELVL
ncbi:MAG TPA: BREX system ATP-binding domain-containing protein [Acidimicrobiales bacterium]|nr:BREX system ATP-binding domain-containing protein [Acidimicrobiales bacterium]